MGRHEIDSEYLGDAVWGDIAFSVAHILRCVFVLAIGESTISNPDVLLFMAKCAFGQIRMNYWGAADDNCNVSIFTVRKANKTLTARNRLDDLETISFFTRARCSGVTCASGYLEIIGVGDLQFDRIKFQNFRFLETRPGNWGAVDCHKNGDVATIVAGENSSFDDFTMLRELRPVVNEYFQDMPDRSFTGTDTAQSKPKIGPLRTWWNHLGGQE